MCTGCPGFGSHAGQIYLHEYLLHVPWIPIDQLSTLDEPVGCSYLIPCGAPCQTTAKQFWTAGLLSAIFAMLPPFDYFEHRAAW